MPTPIITAAPGRGASARHHDLVIALHWLTAIAVAAAFALVLVRELVDEKAVRASLLAVHRGLGLTVFAATLVRLALRPRLHRRLPHAPLPLALRVCAAGSHLGLYALLLAQPLLGWALASAHGQPASLAGLLALPALVDVDPDLADTLGDFHAWAGWTLLAAIGAHAAAALWHHYVRRDAVLVAMLPARPAASAE